MCQKIKIIPLSLDNDSYTINVIISKITDEIMINGTCRGSYIVSIPEWKWSTEIGASRCDESYWQDNLKGYIETALERNIPEVSEMLSKLNMRNIFNES